MPNIWKQNQDINEHPNRNNFDLRYQNHLTMKFGTLYPIMCKEVVPGDSFEINTAFGLKFMPLVFPVQSRMRAHVHYFYVRNKNLWENWENFIEGVEEHTHPYISQPDKFFSTGSLADYLDIPTTLVGPHTKLRTLNTTTFGYNSLDSDGNAFNRPTSDPINGSGGRYTRENLNLRGTMYGYGCDYSNVTEAYLTTNLPSFYSFADTAVQTGTFYLYDTPLLAGQIDNEYGLVFDMASVIGSSSTTSCKIVVMAAPAGALTRGAAENIFNDTRNYSYYNRLMCMISCDVTASLDSNSNRLIVAAGETNPSLTRVIDLINSDQLGDMFRRNTPVVGVNAVEYYVGLVLPNSTNDAIAPQPHAAATKTRNFQPSGKLYYRSTTKDVDADAVTTPFSDSENAIHINALPFRAYESIYNCYYRNQQGNQPFYVNGVEQFNRYNTTLEDGADMTDYHLYQRNYELDYLTSCLPSPQFGTAPLVGMTALGNITIEDENGITTAHAEVDDDGTISKVILTSPAASVEHARTAMNIAQVGMNINDFRQCNALQRFLETTLRKGFKYKDFIEGHFGQSPKYNELDMPEFIGGVSQNVSVNQITNMAEGQGMSALGQMRGTANCFGAGKSSVRHYCDDYGFIVGIMCVIPDPAYSQLLPKHWLHSTQLSYYFPEFSQSGLVPITYKEVCPVQAYNELTEYTSLEDTFGYQRPNYDLVGYTDQVHGLFRTSLKDFLVNRIFETRPELGTDFLEVKPDEVNNIFADTDPASDCILGQVIIDIKAKRPVPRVVIPSLGR